MKDQIDLKSLLSAWPIDRKLVYCDEKIDHGKSFIEKLINLKNHHHKWAVLIGPEGGFADLEKELLTKNKNVIPSYTWR